MIYDIQKLKLVGYSCVTFLSANCNRYIHFSKTLRKSELNRMITIDPCVYCVSTWAQTRASMCMVIGESCVLFIYSIHSNRTLSLRRVLISFFKRFPLYMCWTNIAEWRRRILLYWLTRSTAVNRLKADINLEHVQGSRQTQSVGFYMIVLLVPSLAVHCQARRY